MSCSARNYKSLNEATAPPAETESLEADSGGRQDLSVQVSAQKVEVGNQNTAQDAASPRQVPQLIKTANLIIRVADVEEALDQVSDILQGQQGDILNLEDQQPQRAGDRYISSLQLRVPQRNLTPTLEALEALGTVQKRSIKAQDVSDQLVDSEARLKNLRKSEEVVLKIMERSGKIPDVLSVSKELSTIRENIERIDAQVQSLKTRVAFSTINLRLESVSASNPPKTGVGVQLQEAWKGSTNAVGTLTMTLMKLGIWGVAFSPYLIALGLLIWWGIRIKGKHHRPLKASEPQAKS